MDEGESWWKEEARQAGLIFSQPTCCLTLMFDCRPAQHTNTPTHIILSQVPLSRPAVCSYAPPCV